MSANSTGRSTLKSEHWSFRTLPVLDSSSEHLSNPDKNSRTFPSKSTTHEASPSIIDALMGSLRQLTHGNEPNDWCLLWRSPARPDQTIDHRSAPAGPVGRTRPLERCLVAVEGPARGCSRSPWTRVPALWGRAPRARHLIPESVSVSLSSFLSATATGLKSTPILFF